MMKNILFIFILSFYSSSVFCTGLSKDSLRNVLLSNVADTTKIKTYYALGFEWRQNPDSSLVYYERGLALAKQTSNKKAKAIGLKKIGIIYRNGNDVQKALSFLNEGAALYIELKDNKGAADCYNNMGNAYIVLNVYEKAFEFHDKALKLRIITGDSGDIGASFLNIGEVYRRVKDLENSRICNEKVLSIAKARKDTVMMARVFSNMAFLYEGLQDYKSSMEYSRKSIKLCERMDDKPMTAVAYSSLAGTLNRLRKFQEAIEYLKKSIVLRKELNDKRGMAQALGNIGKIYCNLLDITNAEKYLLEGNELCKEMNIPDLEETLSYQLCKVYEEKKDLTKAIFYLERSRELNDSLHNSGMEDAISKLKTQNALSSQEFELKAQANANIEKMEAINREEQKRKNIIVGSIVFILLVVAAFSFFLYKRFKLTQSQKTVIELQKNEVEQQKHIVEEKQKEILDSIHYANRIQKALLANTTLLEKNLPDYFKFFHPKDIVSGDFYWATEHNGKFYLAVCDSTGHGVPGGFMCLLNIGFLAEAINEKNIEAPNEILNYVRMRLINSISKDGQKDGFDGILICIDLKTRSINYAAANNAPVIVIENSLQHLSCDKMPVGQGEKTDSFRLFEIPGGEAGFLYLYTDGYADQFGGPKGKKFKYKQLDDMLLDISALPVSEQEDILRQKFDAWKGKLEQVDDVCVVGIRI
jgi:serine phosphatase RsbU (regulator of sigma subunit)